MRSRQEVGPKRALPRTEAARLAATLVPNVETSATLFLGKENALSRGLGEGPIQTNLFQLMCSSFPVPAALFCENKLSAGERLTNRRIFFPEVAFL